MSWTKAQIVTLLLDRTVYTLMLILGIYFIYQGDVVQRYQLGRTNFAVYEEPMSELPTIITYISDSNITFGKHYKIYFHQGFEESAEMTLLAIGRNEMANSSSKLFVENLYEGSSAERVFPNLLKITPTNHDNKVAPDFQLQINFEEHKMMNDSLVKVGLRTKNSTVKCLQKYNDGAAHRTYLSIGMLTTLTVWVQKKIYLPSSRRCRNRSYIDILNENTFKNIQRTCTNQCKPKGTFPFCPALCLSKNIDQLPQCKSDNDTKCFYDSFDSTQKLLRTYTGACTKVKYNVASVNKKTWSGKGAKFQVVFDPPRVQVQEEYVIYDSVAVISAIGGTLGLCIGFSFTTFTHTMIGVLEYVTIKVKKAKVQDDS